MLPSDSLDSSLLTQVSTHPLTTFWEPLTISPGPLWWTGYDFDLDALNTSVAVPMETDIPLFQPTTTNVFIPELLSPSSKASEQDLMQLGQRSAHDMVKEGWFTKVNGIRRNDESHDGVTMMHIVPASSTDQYNVDDNFRHRVALTLKERISEEPLPSTNYLVRSGAVLLARP